MTSFCRALRGEEWGHVWAPIRGQKPRRFTNVFTVVGAIDMQRRWNWVMQCRAAWPRLVELAGPFTKRMILFAILPTLPRSQNQKTAIEYGEDAGAMGQGFGKGSRNIS